MPLPDNFALLAVNPAIRENDGFLFLQSGNGGYIDLMLQSATGTPVNILKIASGVPIASTLYVNTNGNDSTATKNTIDFPYKTIQAALNSAGSYETIEVFPGTYNVSGNLYKETINLYFHRGATVNFMPSGRLLVTGTDTGIFNILGNGYFVNDSAPNAAFKITGGQITIEFDGMNLGSANFDIQGVANQQSNIVFRTLGEGNTYGGQFICDKLTIRNANVRFEEIKFQNNRIANSGLLNTASFVDCTFSAIDSSFANPVYQFSGLYNLINCVFLSGSYPKFVSHGKSKIKNTEFQGGITVSGTNYFDNPIFDLQNANVYPNSTLINNLGGNSVFSNGVVKNTNATSNVQYTFKASGAASGATNFNINGTFSSVAPVASGTTIKYGIFNYDTSLR